jgi:hypothetical protein
MQVLPDVQQLNRRQASFKEITIVLIALGAEVYTELTTLNPLQQKIL